MSEFLKLFKFITDNNAEKSAAKLLLDNKLTLSIAESCTGGLVSSLMTDISGSSIYTKINFVTYANEAKIQYLKVKEETLKEFGAVSEQTAREMAQGLLIETDCHIAVSITGIAGPTGGTAEKPVGLVYIGFGSKDKIKVYKYSVNSKFPRRVIKYMFAKHTVSLLEKFLKEQK